MLRRFHENLHFNTAALALGVSSLLVAANWLHSCSRGIPSVESILRAVDFASMIRT
jgi:hypothetical protein